MWIFFKGEQVAYSKLGSFTISRIYIFKVLQILKYCTIKSTINAHSIIVTIPYIPYTRKHLQGKTSTFWMDNSYSWSKFHCNTVYFHCILILLINKAIHNIQEKIHGLFNVNLQRFSPQIFPYTVTRPEEIRPSKNSICMVKEMSLWFIKIYLFLL